MSENIILRILSDIRLEMFSILEDDSEKLQEVLNVIDSEMDHYRGKSNDDIFNELKEIW